MRKNKKSKKKGKEMGEWGNGKRSERRKGKVQKKKGKEQKETQCEGKGRGGKARGKLKNPSPERDAKK